jgi:hypothetical protein
MRNHHSRSVRLAWCVFAASMLFVTACRSSGDGASAKVEAEPVTLDTTLGLVLVEQSAARVVVDLYYQRQADQPAPRAVELFLKASEGLLYEESERLSAAEAAGKRLVVQSNGLGPLRVTLFGTESLDRLDSGPLARFTFHRSGGARATLRILPGDPVFAPAEANQGLRMPEPLKIGG